MTRAATWNRVSHRSELDILANQVTANREHVARQGWTLQPEHEYREVLTSKGITPGLRRVLEAAKAKQFDVVVFTSLSRMTRGGVEYALDILNQLAAAGCGWHFIENAALNFDSSTPEFVRKILLAIIAELDKEYRMRISRNTKRKLDELKAAGTYRGGAGSHKLPCQCVVHRTNPF